MARYFERKTILATGKAYALLPNGTWLMSGTATTRATVRADGGDVAPIGSLYNSSSGGATTAAKLYRKIANATADADWERIVTAAAD